MVSADFAFGWRFFFEEEFEEGGFADTVGSDDGDTGVHVDAEVEMKKEVIKNIYIGHVNLNAISKNFSTPNPILEQGHLPLITKMHII